MWFATRVGLAVYDGASWEVIPQSLRGARTFLAYDQGAVWLVASLPGLAVSRLENGEWNPLPVAESIARAQPSLTAFELTRDSDGCITAAFGTQEHGVLLWQDDRWSRVGPDQGLPLAPVRSISSRGGVLFVIAGSGLYTIADGRANRNLEEQLSPATHDLLAVAAPDSGPEADDSSDPELWLLTAQRLLHLTGGTVTPVGDRLQIASDETSQHQLAIDPQRSAFFSDAHGLLHLNLLSGKVERLDTPAIQLLPQKMLIDREGNLWLASLRGVKKIVSLRLANYTSADGLLEDEVTAVCEPRPGLLVFGHNTGLSLLEGGRFRHLLLPPATSRSQIHRRVIDLAVDSRGTTWIAASQLGLGRLTSHGELEWIGSPDPRDSLYAVIEESPGRLLTGGNRLYRFDGTRFQLLFDWDRMRDGLVRRLLRRRDGSLLLAGPNGVFLLHRESLREVPGSGSSDCYTAHEDRRGRLWVGTRMGLLVARDGALEPPAEAALRFSSPVYLIVEDASGGLWFGTDSGVNCWDGKKLRHFGTDEGLAGLETNRAAGHGDSRGHLWIGTDSGLSLYRKELDRPLRPPPLVDLLGVKVGDQVIDLRTELELEHDQSTIELQFRGISFVSEQAVRYRWLLEGFEQEWSEEQHARSRSARYTNLSPGSYRFHVKAASADGVWSEPVSSPPIIILKPIWSRWWFIAFSAVAGVAMLSTGARVVARWRYAGQLEQEVRQRRRAEVELVEAKNAAEAANQAKSQFLANMSHEIRTPMHAIIGLSRLLVESDLSSQQREQITTISESADSLLAIINNILDFSKIDAGVIDLDITDIDLGSIMRGIWRILSLPARAKHLDLELEIDLQTPLLLQGDGGRIRQILINLVNNAIKFTDRGRVILRVEPAPGAEDCERVELRFLVSDTGIGIPEGKRDTLFNPFSQVDTSTTRRFGGTGLGLAIARQLVEAMGGQIGVVSEEGKGSTFWFCLQLPRQEVAEPSPPEPGSDEPSHHGLILVVEDNIVNQKLAAMLLERMGHRVGIAGNGREAIAALESTAYDLVLMDIQMPVMDGLEATRRIRGSESTVLDPEIPIIAMTALAMKYDGEKCLAAGMNEYLAKPVIPDELESAITRWIGSRA
jgi:signal transduction histidine kinase/ActR/RegA family two-component response regulator